MITIKVEHVTLQILTPDNSEEIIRLLKEQLKLIKEIKMTDADVKALLDKVDATTTKIGSNLNLVATAQASEADTVQKISDEIDAFVANAGLSPENAAKLQAIADRLQTSSDNSDTITAAIQAQVPVLQAIAAKGTATVPEPPPAPTQAPTA